LPPSAIFFFVVVIAWTWTHFVNNTLEPDWLLRMPMTKSSIKAMDAVQEFIETMPEITNVERWVISGASKRGWTAWMVGCMGDPRVEAIIPIVVCALSVCTPVGVVIVVGGGGVVGVVVFVIAVVVIAMVVDIVVVVVVAIVAVVIAIAIAIVLGVPLLCVKVAGDDPAAFDADPHVQLTDSYSIVALCYCTFATVVGPNREVRWHTMWSSWFLCTWRTYLTRSPVTDSICDHSFPLLSTS
jgi:PhoPQ-activated pathogenicity-related protein